MIKRKTFGLAGEDKVFTSGETQTLLNLRVGELTYRFVMILDS